MTAGTREDIRNYGDEFFDAKGDYPFKPMNEPNWLFYSNSSQIEWLKQQDLSLPEGYSYVDLKKSDAVQICAEQLYTSKADEEFIE